MKCAAPVGAWWGKNVEREKTKNTSERDVEGSPKRKCLPDPYFEVGKCFQRILLDCFFRLWQFLWELSFFNSFQFSFRTLQLFFFQEMIKRLNETFAIQKNSFLIWTCILKSEEMTHVRYSGAVSPNFWGAKMFHFRRATVYCLGHRFPKHKMTGYAKNLAGAWSAGPHPGNAYGPLTHGNREPNNLFCRTVDGAIFGRICCLSIFKTCREIKLSVRPLLDSFILNCISAST